jgi:hypothetical protein
VQLK